MSSLAVLSPIVNGQKNEAWRRAWRWGVAPQLSCEALEALRSGLERDDPAIIQGASTTPPALQGVMEWPVEGGCAICYAGWRGLWLRTVREVESFFAQICQRADEALGEPAAIRYFLNQFDEWSRAEMLVELLAEVEWALRTFHAWA